MKFFLTFFCISFLLSCKTQEVVLNSSNEIQLQKGIINEYSPAIAEEKPYTEVYVAFNNFDLATFELVGLYFRNQFIPAGKYPNKISASISKIVDETKSSTQNFPFKLTPFEAVLAYKKNNKIKYVKYTLQQKVSKYNIPR